MGWSYGDDQEVFTLDQMLAKFELSGLKAGGPVFDMEKLTWLNQQYIQNLSWESFWQNFANVEKPEEAKFKVCKQKLESIFPLIKERLDTLQEVYTRHSYFFVDKLDLSEVQLLPKKMEADVFKQKFAGLVDALSSCEWSEEAIDACFKSFKETHELKPRDFFMPIRLMVSGRKDSPPLIPMLLSLGKDKVIERVGAALG